MPYEHRWHSKNITICSEVPPSLSTLLKYCLLSVSSLKQRSYLTNHTLNHSSSLFRTQPHSLLLELGSHMVMVVYCFGHSCLAISWRQSRPFFPSSKAHQRQWEKAAWCHWEGGGRQGIPLASFYLSVHWGGRRKTCHSPAHFRGSLWTSGKLHGLSLFFDLHPPNWKMEVLTFASFLLCPLDLYFH